MIREAALAVFALALGAAQAALSRELTVGTPVVIELAEPVGTEHQKIGDHFKLKLAEPVLIDGAVAIAAGAEGGGEVIDAAAGGAGGRPGKLILAARYIDVGAVRVPLRGFHLFASGRDNGNAAIAASMVPYAGLLSFAIPGGNGRFPSGARAIAKIAADTILPAPADPVTKEPAA